MTLFMPETFTAYELIRHLSVFEPDTPVYLVDGEERIIGIDDIRLSYSLVDPDTLDKEPCQPHITIT